MSNEQCPMTNARGAMRAAPLRFVPRTPYPVLRTSYFVLGTRYSIPILAALLFLLPPAAYAEPPTAVLAEGQPIRGTLAAVDAAWNITWRGEGQNRQTPAASLVWWGTLAETAREPLVVLADGSLIVADVLGADKENLSADSSVLGTLKIPLDLLAGIVYHPSGSRQQRDRMLDRILAATGDSDRLVFDNGDDLSGRIDAISEDAVNVQAAVGPKEIKTERIAAVIFNPALRSPSKADGLRAWVGLSDGSRLKAVKLLVDEQSARIITAGKQTWKTTPKEIVFLQTLGGRATYLSDLQPDGFRQVPYLDLSWPYRADRNVTGGLLRSGGRLYLKGLGVHSAARLTYKLDGSYQRFAAELGIDDSTGARGSVGFRVFVDGQQKYASPVVRGGMAPVPVSIDIAGAKRLDLVVDYADRADELDHADWLGARVEK